MHKNKTVTLLTVCTLLVSNWGLASIDAESAPAGPQPRGALSTTLSSQAPDRGPGTAVLWLAQVGDLLRDTIRRQIRQRLETGEFDDRDLDDDDRVGDDVSNGNQNNNENDNSSPDDVSQDNDDSGLDNSDDASEDSDDDPSNDDADDSDDNDRGNSGVNRGRGPRGSFDSQF